MGFFSFGKKKKQEASLSGHSTALDKGKASIRRPINLTASASASSSITNTSGTDGGSPSPSPPQKPQPRRLHTFNGKQHSKQTSFTAADSSTPNLHANKINKDVPPIPSLPIASSSLNSNSIPIPPARNSLTVPGPSALYANRGLVKQGSSNTLNSVKSNSRRGPHEAPPLSADLMKVAKPRSMSYHASSPIRTIWTASTHGDSMNNLAMTPSSAFGMPGAAVKYASTGSPGMARGSSYMNAHSNMNMGHHAADAEFKEYTRQYEAGISTAHNMAREYHHLPPNKREKERFEKVGQAFAAAARISREHWSYRCFLEKDRISSAPHESLGSGDEMGSPHRMAGMRASEGWHYASMLAEAWGSPDEVSQPLEEMPMPAPRITSSSWSAPSAYLHPGYRPGALAAYSQPANGEIYVPAPGRSRLNSVASYDSFSSSYTHSGLSHSINRSRSHQALSSHGHSMGYLHSSLIQETGPSSPATVVEEEAPSKVIVLKKGKRYRSRASSEATGESSSNALAESSKGSSNHAS